MRSVSFATLLVGCVAGPGADLEVLDEQKLSDGDLPGLDGAPALDGVTVDPDTGDRVVLDAWGGLFRLGEAIERIAGPDTLSAEVAGPYTDVVAMGGGRFAVTVPRDGLLYDDTTGTTTVHFCYLPGSMPVERTQVTDAVAYDAAKDRLWAQPQSFEGAELVASNLYAYDGERGAQPVSTYDLDEKFYARGMAVDGDDLLLGVGTRLHRGRGEGVEEPYVTLDEVLDGDIRGLALDADDHLHVATRTTVFELAGWRP